MNIKENIIITLTETDAYYSKTDINTPKIGRNINSHVAIG